MTGTADLGEIHAWIERDDTLRGQPTRGRQSHFLDRALRTLEAGARSRRRTTRSAYVKRRGSFNTIATGARTIVVGAYVEQSNGASRPIRAAGRRAALQPARHDAAGAAARNSPTLHGLRAAATGVGIACA